MAKFLTLAQLQKEFGITMRSLKELMQREIYDPVKSVADQAKTLADSVRRDADEGRFNGAPGPQGPKGEPGAQGEPGNPGFSPTVHVAEVTGGYRVTITDESGAHDFIVYDGADGADGQDGHTPVITAVRFQGQPRLIIFADGEQIGYVLDGAKGNPGQDGQDGAPGADGEDGYSPTVSVEEITGGHRVTITDAEGSHAFDVMDGQGGGGAVASVNGQTGTVVLDAEDVGARADTWMPTAAQVGARDASTPIGTGDLAAGAVTDYHLVSVPGTAVWSPAGAVKVTTISADWVSASDTIIFDIQPLHGEWADNIAQQEDWGKLAAVLIADGELTFVATEAFTATVYVGCLRVKR